MMPISTFTFIRRLNFNCLLIYFINIYFPVTTKIILGWLSCLVILLDENIFVRSMFLYDKKVLNFRHKSEEKFSFYRSFLQRN